MSSDEVIDALCAAILAGEQIDWSRELAAAASDPHRARVIRNLQRLQSVESAHHRMRIADPSELPFREWRHLRLERRLGAGAHGELFLARDESLGQHVALKLYHELPLSPIARDELLAEARRLARIRNDNVVLVHGVDVDQGRIGFWMEYVQGASLADLLVAGPLRIARVLEIGRALCAALEAAHTARVLHGDIKPTNVLCAEQGRICLVDFGAGRSVVTGRETSMRRTGTPLFMAPETLLEGSLTERSDVYSLGALLFHALTGRYPVEADDLETLAAAHRERGRKPGEAGRDEARFPRLGSLRADVPHSLVATLERCLDPNPERRFTSAADLGRALQGARARRRIPSRLLTGAIASALALAAVALWRSRAETAGREVLHLPRPVKATGLSLALSPAGDEVVFVADEGDHTSLVRVDTHTGAAIPLPGTQNAAAPFFSPDGVWLAFSIDNEIRRLRIHEPGGQAIRICGPAKGAGAWSASDTIAFTGSVGTVHGIWKVSAYGGEAPRRIYTPENRKYAFWPRFVPAGDAVVFIEGDHTISSYGEAPIQRLSLSGLMVPVRTPDDVLRGGCPLPARSSGRLYFWREGQVLTAECDPQVTHVWSIAAVPGIRTHGTLGHGGFDLSRDASVIAYLPERRNSGRSLMVATVGSRKPPVRLRGGRPDEQIYDYSVRFSPTGDRLAIVSGDAQGDVNHNLYLFDPARRVREPLVVKFGDAHSPTWSPDGKVIAFSAVAAEPRGRHIFTVPSDGSAPPQVLARSPAGHPTSWSPEGLLAFHQEESTVPGQTANLDVFVLDTATGTTRPFECSPFDDAQARFSPDGRWVALASNREGRWEVYVKPAAGATAARARRISHGGGLAPVWAPDGATLYYRRADSLFAVAAAALGSTPISTGVAAFAEWLDSSTSGAAEPTYDVRADGAVVLVTEPEVVHDEVVVVREARQNASGPSAR